jgi:hypothetical protein
VTVSAHLNAGARRARAAVVVTVLLLLAVVASSSASARHPTGAHAPGAVVAESCAGHQHALQSVDEHEHEYGNSWTPRLNQRLRADEQAIPLATIVVPSSSPGGGATAAASVDASADVVLSRLGVLRI